MSAYASQRRIINFNVLCFKPVEEADERRNNATKETNRRKKIWDKIIQNKRGRLRKVNNLRLILERQKMAAPFEINYPRC